MQVTGCYGGGAGLRFRRERVCVLLDSAAHALSEGGGGGSRSNAARDWHYPYNYGFAWHFAAPVAEGALLLSVQRMLEAGMIPRL